MLDIQVMTDFCHDEAGLITTVNEPGGAAAPRFWLGRARDGTVVRCRQDVPPDIARRLTALAERLPPVDQLERPLDPSAFVETLAGHGPVVKSWAGPAYRFPASAPLDPAVVPLTTELPHPFAPDLEPWTPDLIDSQPCVGIIGDDQVVAICASVRKSATAHEAGVETAKAWRGQGHARRVIMAWVATVRDAGFIPLYSTSWDNVASQRVAEAAGLRMFGTNLSLT